MFGGRGNEASTIHNRFPELIPHAFCENSMRAIKYWIIWLQYASSISVTKVSLSHSQAWILPERGAGNPFHQSLPGTVKQPLFLSLSLKREDGRLDANCPDRLGQAMVFPLQSSGRGKPKGWTPIIYMNKSIHQIISWVSFEIIPLDNLKCSWSILIYLCGHFYFFCNKCFFCLDSIHWEVTKIFAFL